MVSKPTPAEFKETLDYCKTLLPENYPTAHRVRLELVREWIGQRSQHISMDGLDVLTDWQGYQINWARHGELFEAETPYGLIVIRDTDAGNFYIKLTDLTGVEYDNGEFSGASHSFEEAEAAVRDMLAEVDNPDVEDIHLSNLEFTLDICERLLPSDQVEPHRTRLSWLKGELSSYLL